MLRVHLFSFNTMDEGRTEQTSLERGATQHRASDRDGMQMGEQLLGMARGQHAQKKLP